jgi:hypothetical protein
MTDDIVDRLRVLNHHAKKLAENESLHDLHRDALTRCENLTWQAADEIERLRKECFHLAANQCHAGYGGEYGHHRCAEIDRLTAERDEARRSCCEYAAIVDGADNTEGMESGRFHEVAMRYMKERNWDCFKEDDK